MGLWLELPLMLAQGLAGTHLLIILAPSLGLLDKPNHRSIHIEPTPRGGGIVFTLVALLDLFIFHRTLFTAHLPEMTALAVILAIGILDDRHEAPPRIKFFVIALATLILWDGGVLIDEVGRYFGMEISLGWLALPFTYFAVAGFTNAMNLIDGIDGLAGTISLIILAALAYLGWSEHDPFLWRVSLAFIAGISAFLVYNWHPASLFMGDSGSLILGFLIAMLSIYALEYLPSVSVLYLGAVPIIDTLVAMIRRKRSGRSATAPDRCHFHHLLLQRTGSVPRTVLIMGTVQGAFLLAGLQLEKQMDQTLPLAFFLLLVWAASVLVDREIRARRIECYRS